MSGKLTYLGYLFLSRTLFHLSKINLMFCSYRIFVTCLTSLLMLDVLELTKAVGFMDNCVRSMEGDDQRTDPWL